MAENRKRKMDTSQNEQPTKKVKKASIQKFKSAYTNLWRCLCPSRKGDNHVYCSVCASDLSCAHSGQYDCKRHCDSKSHKQFEKLVKNNTSMTAFLGTANPETTRKRNVTKAELMMCEFIAELNLSLSTSDTFTKAFKQMFPDSKIAAGELLKNCFQSNNSGMGIFRLLANFKLFHQNRFCISYGSKSEVGPILVQGKEILNLGAE